jgi:uncharacterized membrane protein
VIVDDVALARAVHVLAVVHWIGGVAAVTTIVLPRARELPGAKEAVAFFEAFERRFAGQARVSILLAGLSGLYMLIKMNAWDRFQYATFWWMHLMVVVWLLFASMIYVIEPLVVHRKFRELALHQPHHAFAMAQRFHMAVLAISVIAIGAAVLGAHGAL